MRARRLGLVLLGLASVGAVALAAGPRAGLLVAIGIGVLVLVLAATVLSVVFATRAAMAGARDVVEVLHYVGAEHGFIAGEFQRHFLMVGLRGGAIGGGAALAMFLALLVNFSLRDDTPEADQIHALFGAFTMGPAGYLGAFGVVFMIAILTAGTSRLTVRRFLADQK